MVREMASVHPFAHFDYFDYCVRFEDVLEWSRHETEEKTMTALISENFETVAPTEADALLARESSRRLATHKLGRRSSVRIQLLDEGKEAETVAVPASALRLFLHLLTEMSQGNAVTLIPTHAELTTQQAADLLNVSRPYLVKLLDEGKIPCRTVGKYRRVRFDDLMAYKRKDDEARAKILDQLTAEAQELGMGY
jgi:excisionase family DNA binding protein